jgi:non-heme chloroperoxidase
MDHTVPPAVATASYKQQRDNQGVTEIVEIKNRGHALTIDSGWREVPDTALGRWSGVRVVAREASST